MIPTIWSVDSSGVVLYLGEDGCWHDFEKDPPSSNVPAESEEPANASV